MLKNPHFNSVHPLEKTDAGSLLAARRLVQSKQLGKPEAAGDHLLETINAVLDLSKIEVHA
jgi:signal transduction histidine kinase